MMGGGVLLFNRFCAAISPPKVVLVFAQAATSIDASGATAVLHSASRAASISSRLLPGSLQFLRCLTPDGRAGWTRVKVPEKEARPKAVRNVFQSAEFMSLSSTTTIVCPSPVIGVPCARKGLRL